jgi:L-alanine-DL-glutamate epimerase-like enolase superfamily enzyme
MRIESVETLVRGNIAVVLVHTDDGVTGIGQTAPYETAETVHVLHSIVAGYFIGKDPWDVDVLVDAFLREYYKFPSTFILRALGGIDTALYDILGKVTGQPVYKLLGGQARPSVPVYASSMLRDITPEQEADRMLGLIDEFGFKAIKIRIGDAMGRDSDAAPGRTKKIIPLMRQKLGDDIDISADANGGYSASRAVYYGRMLEDYGYFHFEEPTPFGDIEQMAKVAKTLSIAVSGGEQDTLLPQFHRIIDSGAADIIQPDIGYIGGMSRARRVALLAETMGVPCTPHCANDSLLQVFSLHLAIAMPACYQYQEYSIEKTPWSQGVYTPVPIAHEGRLDAPTKPGWGIELLPEFVKSAERRVTRG